MKYYVIIPAHNEAKYIAQTITSLLDQTQAPNTIVVVNDHSTDETASIVENFAAKNTSIRLLSIESDAIHLPGSKVIRAFQKGFDTVDDHYDVIVKLDADLILPTNYFETIISHFTSDDAIGMIGGFAYIEKNNEWILENLTDKDHIRGAFKAYRKKCFEQIGGLKPAMGWDTVDELLAKFYGWKVITDESLQVKHLKPTGANYNKAARFKQGEAFYSLGYGFPITVIASLKLAMMKKQPLLFFDYVQGFWKAKAANQPLLVSAEQANFIQNYRWQKMKEKIFQ
jgi:glycosyltransferase involved in cell wall biosynthesis